MHTPLRKTKIVATMGPTCSDLETLVSLIRAGLNVARFNFSHGTHDDHRERIDLVRRASEEAGIPVALLLDTKGPEIRTGLLKEGLKSIDLVSGEKITLTSQQVPGDEKRLSISYQALPQEVRPGNHILVADGLIDLEVDSTEGTEIYCYIRAGGSIGARKNINVPGVRTNLPAITEKDVEDIEFGISMGMDFIAASFIRKPSDILEIQKILKKRQSPIRVIAKIEDQEGLDNIDEIIRVANGIMVARGDLGVQVPAAAIPLAQKRIIDKCNKANKPVITATQMLDSMINNPQPTRAEVNDVANAIFDGTDAVMLSGETANGKFPIRAVEVMHSVALEVESSQEYKDGCKKYFDISNASVDIGMAVARAAYVVTSDVKAKAMVTPTLRGNTPRLMSRFRPEFSIIAATTDPTVHRQLLLNWGVYPITTTFVNDSEIMIQNALSQAMKAGLVEKNDKVVTAAGIPLNSPIMMNTIKVHFLGNILNRGLRALGASCQGRIHKVSDFAEAEQVAAHHENPILLMESLDEVFLPLLPKVMGIILEKRSAVAPDVLLKHNPRLVVIAEVANALDTFETGQFVSLDGKEKIIYEGIVDV